MKVQKKTWGAAATAFLCVSLSSGISVAAPIAHWSFDEPAGIAGPTDTLTMFATLTNDATSTEAITGVGGSGFAWGNFGTAYSYTSGTSGFASLIDQFSGVNLLPGESMQFVFGVLTPSNGTVSYGTYATQDGLTYLDFKYMEDCCTRREVRAYAENGFERTVAAASVPEPGTMLIMGSGLAGLAFMRRYKKG